MRVGDIEFDAGARTVRRGNVPIDVTAVEFDLLGVFLRAAGVVLQRDDLSRQVLGRELAPFDRGIDVHVSNLRRKLGLLADGSERIKAIRGVGYLYAFTEKPRGR